MGWSGSPSRKSTTTSCPMRGMWIIPQPLPAQIGGDADPARAVRVELPLAVPVELDLHAAVLVGEDLLALRADDDGGLRAAHGRPGVSACGPERHGRGMQSNRFWYSKVDRRRRCGSRRPRSWPCARRRVRTYSPSASKCRSSVELVPGDQVAAVAPAPDRHRPGGLLLHAQAGGPAVVLEDLLQLGGLFRAAAIDAVEPLGVPAGVVVEFQLVGAVETELVRDPPTATESGIFWSASRCLCGQLEAVVPERDLPGPDLLHLLPAGDAALLAVAAQDLVVDQGVVGIRQGGVPAGVLATTISQPSAVWRKK